MVVDYQTENKKIREAYKKIHNNMRILAVRNIQLENRISALEEENSIYILGSLITHGSHVKKNFK